MKRQFKLFLAFMPAASVMMSTSVAADPFLPTKTANIAVTGTAQTLTAPQISNPGPLWQYVITSTASPVSGCTYPVIFTIDGSTATASNGMPVLPNSAFLVSVPRALASLSVIAGGTGCTFYVTAGVGQ